MEKFRKTLLIDLDGVLNQYDGKYNPDYIPEPKEGADEFLKTLAPDYKLVLFTTREGSMAEKWLLKHNLATHFDEVTDKKLPAYLLIDDRCIQFLGDYSKITSEIKAFTPWFKNNNVTPCHPEFISESQSDSKA